jgi:(2Fe-2S) ferredoxin
MSYYQHHVFFCTNQRTNGENCCANHRAAELHAYAKQKIAAMGLNGAGRVRMNKAGCLDRCELGPILVIYPEETWYTFMDESDIDEIISEHLVNGRPVERLKVDGNNKPA